MPGRLWRSWKDWTAGCRCGMKAASSLTRRRRPARYSSETATGVPSMSLSHPLLPTAWANAGPRLSNPWTQGQRTRGIKGATLTARPPPASPNPPPPASRPSFRGRGGRRFRKPGARVCPLERSSGSWESTEPPSRNTWALGVLQRGDLGPVQRRQHLIPWQPNQVTFILNSDTPAVHLPPPLTALLFSNKLALLSPITAALTPTVFPGELAKRFSTVIHCKWSPK